MSCNLNIFQICQRGSRVLGPGLRYVIWVQGCPFQCPFCETPESRDFSPHHLIDVSALAADILSRPQMEGITISGGEPFEQADALAALFETVHEVRPELNILVFTGYRLENLIKQEHQRMLKWIDVLIDGPYVNELNDGVGLRGSSNQRVIFLTNRLLEHKDSLEKGKRRLEIILQGNKIVTIGLLKKRNT